MLSAKHTNVVRAFGCVQWRYGAAILMKYYLRGNLKAYLLFGEDSLSAQMRLRMAYEISCGISHLHHMIPPIIHSDIKPENIFLCQGLHCHIGDFGTAKSIISDNGTERNAFSNEYGLLGMSAAYTAPEKLRDISIPASTNQDTFSFGMTMHMILTRKMPFKTDEEKFAEWIMEGKRPQTKAVDRLEANLRENAQNTIIACLDSQMKKCWSQEPNDRPDMIFVRDCFEKEMKKIPSDTPKKHFDHTIENENLSFESLQNCDPSQKSFVKGKPFPSQVTYVFSR